MPVDEDDPAASALDGVRALLVDIDGVLYVEDEPIAGGRAALARLREAGLAIRFLTNTTAHSRARTLEKLRRLGFEIADEELVTPAGLALAHCRERGHRRAALVMNDEVKRDFAELEEADADADAVIVGDLGDAFSYEVLNAAFRLVMEGAALVALQKNRFWLRADGLALDVGPFVAALEYATGQQAFLVGKPAGAFFLEPLAALGVGAQAAVMVGDDVESDIGGALAAGLRAILVRTGKYRPDVVAASPVEPTAVVASIAEVPALLGVTSGA
jgi:HAD superfamily hydrolase (TIGR01458 family)